MIHSFENSFVKAEMSSNKDDELVVTLTDISLEIRFFMKNSRPYISQNSINGEPLEISIESFIEVMEEVGQ